MKKAAAAGLALGALTVTGCLQSLAAGPLADELGSTDSGFAETELICGIDDELTRTTVTPAIPARDLTALPPVASSRYSILPEVTISQSAKKKLAEIATAYHRRTGKSLVVTSGTRGPKQQAKAMYDLLQLGTDVVALYKNKPAARQIKRAYDRSRSLGKSESSVVADMASVISAQMARGVYISAHLRAGALDIRNRTMTDADKRAFVAATSEVGDVSVLEEMRPPHYHLQIK